MVPNTSASSFIDPTFSENCLIEVKNDKISLLASTSFDHCYQ